MAEATSHKECVERHRTYRDLVGDLKIQFHRERLKELTRMIDPGTSVLDIGCNSGYLIDFLPKNCSVLGIDVNPDRVEEAIERGMAASLGEAESIPFADDFVDVCVLAEILEHVFSPRDVISEAIRVARSLVIGSTPHHESAWGHSGEHRPERHQYHVRCFTQKELAELIVSFKPKSYKVWSLDRNWKPALHIFRIDL